ncbi:MAG: DUF192 domain-containing protein [Novosphingobium sp.]
MRLIRTLAALLLVPVLLPAAAWSQATPEAATGTAAPQTDMHPVSGLPVIPLTVASGGRTHTFRVEVAKSGSEQKKGLMFRTAMGADEGMIFPVSRPRRVAFWMKNTVIPLDIVFIGPDRRILNIAANAVPYDKTPLRSAGAVGAVLELNGGRAGELGIGSGDTVTW